MSCAFNPRLIPLSKKKAYLLTFSEDDFRDKVIRPLYLMQGMEHAKDVCGASEEGKDCYFWVTDPIRTRCLYAVQTKKGHLNMSSKAKENVVRAATQLRTALEAAVFDGKTKQKFTPACVVLVASGEINQAANRHISQEIPDSRIAFQDSDVLIPLIDKHMPEFWNGLDANRLPYLKGLQDRLISRTSTIDITEIGVDAGVSSPIIDENYVQLYLHRLVIRPSRRLGQVHETVRNEEMRAQDVLEVRERLVLITGGAGSGKTTTLNRFALTLVENALKSATPSKIPVCLTTYQILCSPESLLELATRVTREITPSGSAAFDVGDLDHGRVVMLIDGLDEVGNSEERKAVLEKILAFHKRYNACQVVLTTRDHPFVQKLLEDYPFVQFQISAISFRQAEKMIQRLASGKSLSGEDMQEMLRRLENIHGLELNPLLVTVFVATADYARSDIPANITELFKKYTEMMLGRWQRTKALSQQYHAPLKDFLLQRIAFHMHREKTTAIPIAECRALIEKELTERGHEADFDVLFSEIVYASGLVCSDETELSFRHQLLQEFFAGRGIPDVQFLSEVASDAWWTKAIVFYFGEHPHDSTGLTVLRKGIEQVGSDSLQSAVTVGLATQACYLMRRQEKHEAMRWVVDRLAHAKNDFIRRMPPRESNATLPILFYAIYGRDAVAARIIAEVAESLAREQAANERSEIDETTMFWCLVGLVESRQLASARKYLETFDPADNRLLLGLYFGALYVEGAHVTSAEHKCEAKQICERIAPKIEYLLPEIVKEFKGLLLEVRKGQLSVLDAENTPASPETSK